MVSSAPTGIGGNGLNPSKKPRLFKVSPYMVIPSKVGGFSLFLKQEDNYVLYSEKGELYTDAHKERLGKLEIEHLYIKAEDYPQYSNYIQEHLQELLDDDSIPVRERARAWNDATVSLAKEAFDRRLPRGLDKRNFRKISMLVARSLRFLERDDALRELSRFIAEGKEEYEHGIGVMVLAISVLSSFIRDGEDMVVAVGMGAMLHDIGKVELPENLFTRRMDSLSQSELDMIKSHPALGVGVCSSLPLPQETLQCILFHHEREDGSGYPSGSSSEMLPSYVKVVALCNEYDKLVRGGPNQKRLTPFEALIRIKNRRSAFDPEILRRLIEVLSKANIT